LLLTEIIKDVEIRERIQLDDSHTLTNVYDIDGEKISGSQCVAKFIAETLAKGYKLTAEKVFLADEPVDFVTGPEQMLVILYKTRIINELASKYKLITSDESLDDLKTWEAYLKPEIFKEILANPTTLSKMQEIDLNEFLPKLKKTNKDQTVTSYKYKFYEAEKPEWADNKRLKFVSFINGYLKIKIDLPVQEVPDVSDAVETPELGMESPEGEMV